MPLVDKRFYNFPLLSSWHLPKKAQKTPLPDNKKPRTNHGTHGTKATKADRIAKEQKIADYLQEAVDQELERIVAGLEELGIKPQTKTSPCRWPINGKLLAKLRKASDKTGIAATLSRQ